MSDLTDFQAKYIDVRAATLYRRIRCVVCAGQTIEDSPTDFAVLMRTIVRQKLREGLDDEQVLKFLADTYGPEVLYAGGLDTAVLVAAGVATAAAVGIGLYAALRRRAPANTTRPVTRTSVLADAVLRTLGRAGIGPRRWPRVPLRAMDSLLSSDFHMQAHEVVKYRELFRIPPPSSPRVVR